MPQQYDLVVIGTGTGATGAASRCRAAGWRVAVIDYLPFGGTCALRGCDPKKVLVGAAEAIDHARRMQGHGLSGGEPAIAWSDLMRFKRSFTEPVAAMKEKSFAKHGIDAYHGHAKFCGPRSVEVDGEVLEGRFVLIAVGSVPMHLGIAGEEHVITSTDFLELDRLPKRIVLLGGGFIAAEFANIAAQAGAQVTVLEQMDRMLAPFDPDLVGWLMEKFIEVGIDVRLQTRVTAIETSSDGLTVRASSNGKHELFKADLVVHAAGRVPDLEPLDLARAGVTTVKGRLALNEFLQSVSNPAVYAVGDGASSGPALTPVSSHDAKVAAANMLEGNHAMPDYLGVPSVAFTTPPIASVGMSEQQVRESGVKFRMQSEKASSWFTAKRVAEMTYGFKVMVDEETDRILGAHLIGPHCDEVINIFALAIRKGLTAEDLKTTMFAYPTATSDIGYML
uniref:Pyruvate/2-oxoglutarate dehydrogenase complex, dihydrolipoamide dehydrogenase (E3) component or related enzyme n=1 Tax=Polaromonas sp. H6N TaxID=1840293 RepID=A0A2S1FIB5_9BURK|nr:NAD(P)/FAD-dependent oxidoreductase [Polaromonas sp. H6N]AWD72240.1 pyruvate/2-oxoglutarate dehydrogenase complex, dihydrolipoamide dehydrogenase (E3) component or related enzyme [Polaromonas sp. H6N]